MRNASHPGGRQGLVCIKKIKNILFTAVLILTPIPPPPKTNVS
uniref:Putative ARM repeat-containing protein n=1 Tax=Moniliophthora roreri TaxID=221103 RepID=A0A0W0F4N6_MONRR